MAKVGRPTQYKPEYVKKADEYLEACQDEEVQKVKQANSEVGYEMYENKLKVKLPTIEGFAAVLGVNKTTLYEWEKEHRQFSNALDKIRAEQHDRLINNGLSGDYNPTIAKLVLSSNHGYAEKTDMSTHLNHSLDVEDPVYKAILARESQRADIKISGAE
jgi:hypothetical protein